MNKLFLFVCFLLASQFTQAQNIFVKGEIRSSISASVDGATVVVYQNGNVLKKQNVNFSGEFEIKLPLNGDYLLFFENRGYITKIVNVNTEVPEQAVASNPDFPSNKLNVTLYPTVVGVDISIFEQPIAIMAYDPKTDDIMFDAEYYNRIKDKITKTELEVKRVYEETNSSKIEKERDFANLVRKGQQYFNNKEWKNAIDSWNQALAINPNSRDVKLKLALARKEAGLEDDRVDAGQGRAAYQRLINLGDSLIDIKKYAEAKKNFTAATRMNAVDQYPVNRLKDIDTLIKRDKEEQEKLAKMEAKYKQLIATGDSAYKIRSYEVAIASFREAVILRPEDEYPRRMVVLSRQALSDLQKRSVVDTKKQLTEESLKAIAREKYNKLIMDGDYAYNRQNYGAAKNYYLEADMLGLKEPYPQKQLEAINNIISSTKYKSQLGEHSKNKELGYKNMETKNYAAARVFFQRAKALSSASDDEINKKLAELDNLMKSVNQSASDKKYQEEIIKADKAFDSKSYTVAKVYYQNALKIKPGDKHAQDRLKEIELHIRASQLN